MDAINSDDEDEQLKRAIALSLQDAATTVPSKHGVRPVVDLANEHDPVSSILAHDQRTDDLVPIRASNPGMLGLDRKAMEEQRLARKRRTSTSPPPLRAKAVRTGNGRLPSDKDANSSLMILPQLAVHGASVHKGSPVSDIAAAELPAKVLQFPDGIVKKTWVLGFPRQEDVTIEEVLEAKDLKLAVLSSFQWDVEWLLRKLDTASTKIIMVMQAKDETTKQKYTRETADMPSLRLCFPSMEGQVNCMHSKLMLLAHPSYLRVVVPTANLVPYDWGESGVMENTVFLIDLPRHPKGQRTLKSQLTFFGTELIYFCEAMRLQEDTVSSLYDFDFSATTTIAFVHTIGGVHMGEGDPWRRTGYCGLGRAVHHLGLATKQELEIDFITSSIGALSDDFLAMLYLAAQGDDGLTEYNRRISRSAKSGRSKEAASQDTVARQELVKVLEKNFRLYFPSQGTVLRSRGGAKCAGPICFSSRWYNASTFPQQVMRDCQSVREGLLMHNKIIYVRQQAPQNSTEGAVRGAWAYIGSANCSESAWGKLVQEKATKEPKLNCRNWECGVVIAVRSVGSTKSHLNKSTSGGLDIFRGTIPICVRYPGDRYESRQPWYYADQ